MSTGQFKPRVIVPFTHERATRFLDEYRKTGRKHESALLAGLSYGQISAQMKLDKDFAEAVDEAFNLFVEEVLEKEVHRRAIEGWTNPIFGGRFKDQKVGEERLFSDNLMRDMLKAHSPKYRQSPVPHQASLAPGAAGGVLMLPSSVARTPGEWEKVYGEMAEGKSYMPMDERENELRLTGKLNHED